MSEIDKKLTDFCETVLNIPNTKLTGNVEMGGLLKLFYINKVEKRLLFFAKVKIEEKNIDDIISNIHCYLEKHDGIEIITFINHAYYYKDDISEIVKKRSESKIQIYNNQIVIRNFDSENLQEILENKSDYIFNLIRIGFFTTLDGYLTSCNSTQNQLNTYFKKIVDLKFSNHLVGLNN